MEFLIAVVILALGAFIGYKYYQTLQAGEQPAVLDLPVEAVVESAPAAEVTDPVVETEIKKERPKKAPAKKTAAKSETYRETPAKAAPKKKKPTMKVVK